MYRFFILFSIGLCCNLVAEARPISQLSFDQALEIALEHNPALQAKRLGLDVNKAEIKTARARPDPQLFSDSGIAEDTYRVGLSYNLEMGGKRKKRAKISETNLEQAEITLSQNLLVFREELRSAYAELFYSKERLKLREDLKTSYSELLKVSQKRESLGDIAQIDVMQVEAIKVTNENQYKKSLYGVNQSHNNLEYLLNTELHDDVQLESPLDLFQQDPSLERLIEAAVTDRPEIKANQISQKLTKQQLNLAKTNRVPDLTLAAGPDFVTGDSSQTSAFVMAQITLPIFNLRKGEIETAEAKQQQLLAEQEAGINKIKTEVEQTFLAYLSQKEVLGDYATKLIPIQKEYAEKRLRSFELGKSSIGVVLDAQSQYTEVRLELIELSLEYQKTISLLERATGVDLP